MSSLVGSLNGQEGSPNDLVASGRFLEWYAEVTIGLTGSPIPDISHLNHLYIGGEKMWRNFSF